MQRRAPIDGQKLSDQVKDRLADKPIIKKSGKLVSTGSTLLDLAISGGTYDEGGLPGGILVEIFGPSGCGKTVLLCEIAGGVQRAGGEALFRDPEARLDKQFASLFGFDADKASYGTPDTVVELFESIREWKPSREDEINGIFADSLAALSTEMEMADKDKMGQKRAKDFSEQCRKTCRILTQRNLLMVCSNQVRENIDAGPYSEKYKTPGGTAIGFYASVRLRCRQNEKLKREVTIGGKKQTRVYGVETAIHVMKNSIDKPYRDALLRIDFEYGIDDVSANLDFLKTSTGMTTYQLGETKLGASLERAARSVEEGNLEADLRQRVIELWHEIEEKFKVERKPKVRM